VTSESLEVRQQIERDLVSKINVTLEPLLGASEFRAGASVDCDLTSAEQQEETFNPDQSVMVTSQKSEDSNERPPAGVIPGTAANLPHPPGQSTGSSGSSHRTENVTYQSSRVVKHTRIPQGVIRRMSLSVLVGQPAHWEGAGKSRRRVVVPPSPEKLKTIRDLVAGVTGFSADRGDQLIVETLPFESAVDADPGLFSPVSTAKPSAGPPWLDFLTKYQSAILIAVALLTAFSFLLRMALRFMSTRPAQSGSTEISPELPLPPAVHEGRQPVSPPAQESGSAAASLPVPPVAALPPPDEKAVGRIRTLVQNEPDVAANVVRMWLQNQRS
jgi:flagellar M-ring protein FliF